MIIIIYFVLLSWQLSQSTNKLMFILGSTRDLHVQLLQVVYYTNGFSFSTAMTKVIHVSKINETKNILMTPLLNLRVSNCSLMKLSDLYMWCNHCSVAVSVHVHLALCMWLTSVALCNVQCDFIWYTFDMTIPFWNYDRFACANGFTPIFCNLVRIL